MHCEQQQQQQQQPVTGPNFLKGALSRYQNGQYDCSVYEAHLTLDAQRATPGAHKIVAMALLAMAKQQKSANTLLSMPRKDGIQIYYGTLDCVIEVVYKGFVYEEQWNDHNTSINRDFLQELCDLKAPGVSIIQDSGGGQLVRDTNRSNKTKGNKKRY